MTPQTAEAVAHAPPQVGDPFRLNGFDYVLASRKRTITDAEQEVRLWTFARPRGEDADQEARYRGNPHYYAGGSSVLESEMLWLERPEWQSRVREEAAQLARSGDSASARLWGTVSGEALIEARAEVGGAWCLPGRYLLDQPMEVFLDGATLDERDQPRRSLRYLVLADADEAQAIAALILRSEYHAPRRQEG